MSAADTMVVGQSVRLQLATSLITAEVKWIGRERIAFTVTEDPGRTGFTSLAGRQLTLDKDRISAPGEPA